MFHISQKSETPKSAHPSVNLPPNAYIKFSGLQHSEYDVVTHVSFIWIDYISAILVFFSP